MMKKLLTTLAALALILIPSIAFANFPISWLATSTTQGWIYPNQLNGASSTIFVSNFITASTTASSTAANGINLTKGCFAVNNVCVGGSGGTPGGSNTQVQYNNAGVFAGTSCLTIISSGTILNTGCNITFNQSVDFNNSSVSNVGIFNFKTLGPGFLFTPGSGGPVTATSAPTVSYLISTSTTASSFAGFIGIATTSPYAKLSVQMAAAGDALAIASTTNAGAIPNATTFKINGKDGHTSIGYDQGATNTYVDNADQSILNLNFQSYNLGGTLVPIFSQKNRAGTINFCTTDQGTIHVGNSATTCTVSSGTAAQFDGFVDIQSSAANAGGDAGFQVEDRNNAIGNGWQFYAVNKQFNFYSQANTKNEVTIDGVTEKFGIGTTTPYAKLSVQSNTATGIVFAVATTTGANLFQVDNKGNQITGGDVPTVSCSPSGGTVLGDNTQGQITTGTLSTACTLTFSNGGYPSGGTMSCTVSDNSTGVSFDVSTLSNTSVTFASAGTLTSGILFYQCGESLKKN